MRLRSFLAKATQVRQSPREKVEVSLRSNNQLNKLGVADFTELQFLTAETLENVCLSVDRDVLRPEVILFIAATGAKGNEVIDFKVAAPARIEPVAQFSVLAEDHLFEHRVHISVTVRDSLSVSVSVWTVTHATRC